MNVGTLAQALRHDSAVVTDRIGRVVASTDGFRRLVGRRVEIGSLPPFPWWPPEERDLLDGLFARVMSRSADALEGRALRLTVLHANGERVPVDVAFHSLRNEQVCFVYDPVIEKSAAGDQKRLIAKALSDLSRMLKDLGVPVPLPARPEPELALDRMALSYRESQILNLLLEGMRHNQIAKLLGLSTHTIKHHIQSVYRKIGVRSHVELLAAALLELKASTDPGKHLAPEAKGRSESDRTDDVLEA